MPPPTVVSYRNSTSNHNNYLGCILWLRVVSYRNSTSNHNHENVYIYNGMLYLIEILHQTTTNLSQRIRHQRCILSKFYIKPQQLVDKGATITSCILSKFYIKPQRPGRTVKGTHRCILSKFYIKPQQYSPYDISRKVVSYRNSTSNHNSCLCISEETAVVSYRNSTSNHNCKQKRPNQPRVVSYRNSTSNHNCRAARASIVLLYLIEILHQTTTSCPNNLSKPALYLIEILHQTTTSGLILIDKVLLTGCLPL